MTFADRLKRLRESHGLLQKELAEKLEVKRQTITGWERGTREPNIEKLIKISVFFDCSLDYLLCKTEQKKQQQRNKYLIACEKIKKIESKDLSIIIDLLREFQS